MENFEEFKNPLEEFLRKETNNAVVITGAIPLAGGASRDSWLLDVKIGADEQKLVLRKDLPTQMNDNALTREQEFTLMHFAYEQGVKVARVRFACNDPDVLGHPFFIMDFVEGISIGRKVITLPELTGAREKLPEQMAEQLAKIHQLDIETGNLDFLSTPLDDSPTKDAVSYSYQLLDDLGLHNPAFEFALRWAEQHQPDVQRITLIHGDFRVGNLLVNQEGLTAVIDWEFAHIGDPVEEIGYLCMRDWRFGNGHLRAGGLCDRERFIRAYETHSGHVVDRYAADWWELLGNIRWGIICLSQAERHLSGRDPSVELASLGRRSAEMQLESLNIIERMGV